MIIFVAMFGTGCSILNAGIRKRLKSIFNRGMRLHSVEEYHKLAKKADGFYISVLDPQIKTEKSFGFRSRSRQIDDRNAKVYKLRISRQEESKGTLLLGDSGTGKSLLLHQVIDYARGERKEPGVCYDPASEFVQFHYRADRDFILNPLDERFPNWELRNEIRNASDLDLIAESFFPSKFIRDNTTKFFNQAAQDVFKLILAKKTTNQEIVDIISSPERIDEVVKGTEIAHKIDSEAKPQRAGVLASLADVGKVLRLIPPTQPGRKNFSFTGWASGKKRNSWLFLTMSSDSRDSLRPFVSAMLNILMRRLMSIPQARRENDAWWFIADELHTLNSLSALPDFVAECRKHGIRYFLGTQSKFQITEQYGEGARAILAQSKLKIFFRSNESDSAQWVSQNTGSQETTRTQVSASLPTDMQGRDSVSFQNVTDNYVLFTKEQIMSLPDLHAVWRFGDAAVPFKLCYINRKIRHPDFIPLPIETPAPTQPQTKVQKPSPVETDVYPPPKAVRISNLIEVDTKHSDSAKPMPGETGEPKTNNSSHQEPPDYSNEIRLDF